MDADSTDNTPMTEEAIIRRCKMHQGYATPELNEKLYLHYVGFRKIASLEPFHNCTVLYLNNNAIDSLEGLYPLQKLHSLYLSNNTLRDCRSLPALPALRLLDVSNNSITSLEGLASALGLETLLAARNRVANLQGLEPLDHLINIDVSHNWISQADHALPLLLRKKELRTCMLQGNSFVRTTPSYRKFLIAQIPSLRFLDQYPIFYEERSCAEAYAIGGVELEKAKREENQRNEDEERRKQFLFFTEAQAMMRGHRMSEGMCVGSTAYFDCNNYEDVYVPNR
ncbi:putative dynein assembly factor 1, axonemal-like [Trypanosoma rangeli]|uniref:Putative dynein assembly factor 1, axonemal-like n=1 Tax=Trypanosoma rangeli TaxID=5698 RepID=A0A422NC68_TRYRA|nr:putative dynein assembly factor 1, axonemal-like [Trypanosoma rangeli]RNF03063.1 putative dynein assembly factor 1, axonemal-like [Trypanosoma rangeli]|eukprot:RNF03063.1 putative dynein assembly factor 1, axonemal-like [Trypanosoma rangeli]